MTSLHARHPAEWDPSCPDCTGDYPARRPGRARRCSPSSRENPQMDTSPEITTSPEFDGPFLAVGSAVDVGGVRYEVTDVLRSLDDAEFFLVRSGGTSDDPD